MKNQKEIAKEQKKELEARKKELRKLGTKKLAEMITDQERSTGDIIFELSGFEVKAKNHLRHLEEAKKANKSLSDQVLIERKKAERYKELHESALDAVIKHEARMLVEQDQKDQKRMMGESSEA